MFAKIYLGEFDTQFTAVRLIKLHVLIAGILLILVSLLASAICKVKWNTKDGHLQG